MKKFNLINSKEVIATYKNGGLSIKLLGLMNMALGIKLTWRFITGENYGGKKPLRKNISMQQGPQSWKIMFRLDHAPTMHPNLERNHQCNPTNQGQHHSET